MEIQELTYEKLFSIRFSHISFPLSAQQGGTISDTMSLEPDSITKTLFTKHDIHYRLRSDILLCFIRIRDEEKSPFFRLPKPFVPRFLVNLKSELINKTSISVNHGRNKIYHFEKNFRSGKFDYFLSNKNPVKVKSRDLIKVNNPEIPGFWMTKEIDLNDFFCVVDFQQIGNSYNRLFLSDDNLTTIENENNQILFFTDSHINQHLMHIQFS